jgi:hypothetical protein
MPLFRWGDAGAGWGWKNDGAVMGKIASPDASLGALIARNDRLWEQLRPLDYKTRGVHMDRFYVKPMAF